jgi:diguanylate cyclase (GGDEF)-like protein
MVTIGDMMELHVPTLAIVAVFVTAILGALLILAWRRDQSTSALVRWGISYLLGGAGLGLLAARGAIPDVLSIEIANTATLLSYTMLLAGARAFGGRDTPLPVYLVAPLLWLIAMRIPAVHADIQIRVVLITSCQCTFTGLVAYEFWRERAEPLLSRWPAIIVLVTHAIWVSLRVPALIMSPVGASAEFFRSPTFAAMAFGSILYTITFAFLLLAMTKERGELRHKQASLIDSLTGLANRRAFINDADAAIAGLATRGEPLAVLLADLDHFKKINDRFGHATGDQVLNIFAATLRRSIGPNDLVGRLGGEEFGILLAASNEAAARATAERIRSAFAQAATELDGRAVGATVSIGLAASPPGAHDLPGLLTRADGALYQAKECGRNRVVVCADHRDFDDASLVPAAAFASMRMRAAARA